MKSEKAKVVNKIFKPEESHTTIQSHHIGNTTVYFPVKHTTPEYYGVQFICDEHHQAFEFSSKSLYERVHEGEIITLKYVDEIQIHKKTGEQKVVDHHTLRIIFENGDEILKHIGDPEFARYYTDAEISVLMKSLTNK
ncbi:MAG: hypothetical protein PHP92_03875 [Candidatus Nanoarchaeia archaeon]|nr:hypothetical protein [Candidatus Nanoarchaeia archaeon]